MVSENNEIVDEHNEHSEAVSPSSTYSHFGQRLLYIRNSMDLTKSQFALLLKYKSSDISKWESGSEIPDMDTIADIAKKLSIDKSYFLTEEKNPTISSHAARTTGGNLTQAESLLLKRLNLYILDVKIGLIACPIVAVILLIFLIVSSIITHTSWLALAGVLSMIGFVIFELALYYGHYKKLIYRKKIFMAEKKFRTKNKLD